jgi:hypothetical protein
VEEPAKIFEGVRNALEEVRATFVKAAETVSAESLQDADVNVGVVVLEKSIAFDVGVFGDGIEIVIEELLAEFRGEIGFGVEEERGEIVLKRAFATALVIEEIGFAAGKHDVAGLKIAIEKKVSIG